MCTRKKKKRQFRFLLFTTGQPRSFRWSLFLRKKLCRRDFRWFSWNLLGFSLRVPRKTLQLFEIFRFQFNFSMIIPEIHLIFDLIFDLILFNFRFNFHIGTTPSASSVSNSLTRALRRANTRGRQPRNAWHAAEMNGSAICNFVIFFATVFFSNASWAGVLPVERDTAIWFCIFWCRCQTCGYQNFVHAMISPMSRF